VKKVDLEKCRPFKDFGRGFYLTTIKSQAEDMASRVSRIYGGEPVISTFILDEAALSGLNVREFEKPSTNWAEFVINNRNRSFIDISSPENNHDNKYDIVIGPVANDDMALLFRQLTDGIITIEMLSGEMEFKQLTNQYSFHTVQAVKALMYKEESHD
jgi:hypothetical protein